jgi:hypothetical protein
MMESLGPTMLVVFMKKHFFIFPKGSMFCGGDHLGYLSITKFMHFAKNHQWITYTTINLNNSIVFEH